MDRLGARLGNVLIAVATAVGILALVLPLFLNPVWVGFEQGRAEAAAWTGFSEADLRVATDAILADLVVGPPDLDLEVARRDGRVWPRFQGTTARADEILGYAKNGRGFYSGSPRRMPTMRDFREGRAVLPTRESIYRPLRYESEGD